MKETAFFSLEKDSPDVLSERFLRDMKKKQHLSITRGIKTVTLKPS